ncbi:odorant receptor Or1-like [Halyomorpha halys]|uniref:odorant receptor Or1-like n=1 Tax=Halyomorpha halys TaxID=286706 RepID=UPI0006D517B8|nr:Odorant receptor 6 [Halyomorpha halys]
MWDWRQLNWLYYFGWWPSAAKTEVGYKINRVYGIALFIWDFIQIGPEVAALYIALSNGSLKGTVLNLNTVLMGGVCFMKITGILLNEANIKWIIAKLEEMENRGKNMLGLNEYKMIADYRDRRCKLLVIIVFTYLSGLVQWVVRPIYDICNGRTSLIIEAVIPWDKDTIYGWTIVFILQFVHLTTAIMALIIIYVLYLSIMEMILCQIDVLHYSLKKLDFSPPGADYHSSITLRYCVKQHQDILSLCYRFHKVVNVQLFVFMMFSTVVLCLSVFELSSIKDTTLFKVSNLLELTLNTVFLIFMYCLYCHNTVDKLTEGTLRAAYKNNWYMGREEDKKSLDILCTMSIKPFEFGFIIPVNLDTFITVLKSAFSYYNFLKAIADEE